MELSGISAPLLTWFRENARALPWRSDPSPYHIWVSEIMLQQTRIEAVKGYYERFLKRLPDIRSLAEADEETLLKLWEGLGYYNRVRNMHRAACVIMEKYGGEMPASYEELRQLPGIGDYTAAAVASIGFGICVPCVDGNVLRVTKRLEGSTEDIAKETVRKDTRERLQELMRQEIQPGEAGAFNEALMELGEVICVPNGAPFCEMCPLAAQCETRRTGNWAQIPVKSPNKPRRQEKRTVFILRDGERTALLKRAGKGLLAGLWELPSADGWLSEEEALAWLAGQGIRAASIAGTEDAKHIFTHVEWHMRGYVADVIPGEEDPFVWTTRAEREASYALPSAFAGFRRYLG